MSKPITRIISFMLAVLFIAGAFAGCASNSKNDDAAVKAALEELNLSEEEKANLLEGYDPEADTDLDAERNKDASYAGTIAQDSFTNSSLVSYKKISPNKTSPRNHAIDTITIHCMAGQLSVETCGRVFASTSAEASANYGIGDDGRIALYVEEKDRSWCSSNRENDNRAVTIEVASYSYAPYEVSDAAYKSLIKLVADICKRNNIEKLVWSDDKETRVKHLDGANMTVHRDYAKKVCPGEYLYNHMGDIAKKVNKKLGVQ